MHQRWIAIFSVNCDAAISILPRSTAASLILRLLLLPETCLQDAYYSMASAEPIVSSKRDAHQLAEVYVSAVTAGGAGVSWGRPKGDPGVPQVEQYRDVTRAHGLPQGPQLAQR